MVADRLRYTEDIDEAAAGDRVPASARSPSRAILKGIICHGMWLVAPAPELVRGRRVVAHNNLLGDVKNMGAVYVDEDVVVDGDLVTGRTGGHCHLFAQQDHRAAARTRRNGAMTDAPIHHMGLDLRRPDRDGAVVHEALRLHAQARLPARPRPGGRDRQRRRAASSCSRRRAKRRRRAARRTGRSTPAGVTSRSSSTTSTRSLQRWGTTRSSRSARST